MTRDNDRSGHREPPRSPCDGNCVLDPATGWCEGCWRTIREIAGWTKYSPERRREVLEAVRRRRAGLEPPSDQDDYI
jgi:hypothetical protein